MRRYQVEVTPRARKQLRNLTTRVQEQISPVIDALAENPRPDGVVKLKGRGKQEPQWRIRVGDYRVVYEIHDKVLRVVVVEVDDRKNVYR